MGVLGLAIAAFEHFSTKSQTESAPMQYNRASTPVAPLPERPDEATPHPALDWTPPPLPTAAAHPDPVATSNPDALLLIRAMIAAANADHFIDDQERAAILKRVTESGLGEAEQVFIQGELANPIELRTLAAQVRTPEMAEQIFAVSLMAIDVDSEAEQNYLQQLASALKLAPSVVEKWKTHLAGSSTPQSKPKND